MTYTQLAIAAVVIATSLDYSVFKTRLIQQKIFWISYAIIIGFQFLTNGLFTGLQIVKYRDFAILGSDSPIDSPPPFLGDGRLFFAPIEDVGFGFSIVLLSLSIWVFVQKKSSDREIVAGPPRTSFFSRL